MSTETENPEPLFFLFSFHLSLDFLSFVPQHSTKKAVDLLNDANRVVSEGQTPFAAQVLFEAFSMFFHVFFALVVPLFFEIFFILPLLLIFVCFFFFTMAFHVSFFFSFLFSLLFLHFFNFVYRF